MTWAAVKVELKALRRLEIEKSPNSREYAELAFLLQKKRHHLESIRL